MATRAPKTTKKSFLQRLTSNEAQARSLVAQRVRDLPFNWFEESWQLSLTPLAQSGPLAASPSHWRLFLRWAGAPFELVLPQVAAHSWVDAQFPDLDVGALPDELAAAVLEAAAGELTERLAHQQRGAVQIESLQRGTGTGEALTHVFEVVISCEDESVRALLATDSLGLMLMAGLVSRQPVAANDLPADDLPLVLRAEIGFTWLAASQMQQLSVGSAILVEHPFLTSEAQLWLGRDAWGVRVRYEETRLVVTETLTHLKITMAEPTSAPPASAEGAEAPTGFDKLPMRLVFDLGERTLTLGDIKALQVGQALDLERPLSSAVTLRVNGMPIGTGDIVEIDGRVGVAITSLINSGGSGA